MTAEFDLIAAIRARAQPSRRDVVLGIGDDAALLQPAPGLQLAVAMDTLNAGVHFPVETAAADIGWKALAVNLSDLAAMGAAPAWCTLSLSLPDPTLSWLDGFLDGFLALAGEHGVALVGGDTTRGPLSISVTVHGLVEPGRALRRRGAVPGDGVWVTGTLGDAAGALAQWRAGSPMAAPLRIRLDRPQPRVAVGRALQGLAHACIDVSDGLLADLGHLCSASGVGAEIDVDALPLSPSLRDAFDGDARRALQASGGDDYELCFTVGADAGRALDEAAHAIGVAMTCIGRVVDAPGVRALAQGTPWRPPGPDGHEHFRAGG
ncbi:MAG TPA: thiamine-phosphate kinase [Luteimonas sp.]|nr:thiamine-phosphate kinase [Luteimonas sp.]